MYSLGYNIKLLYKSHRLLRSPLGPKHKGSHKELNINVVILKNNHK